MKKYYFEFVHSNHISTLRFSILLVSEKTNNFAGTELGFYRFE